MIHGLGIGLGTSELMIILFVALIISVFVALVASWFVSDLWVLYSRCPR